MFLALIKKIHYRRFKNIESARTGSGRIGIGMQGSTSISYCQSLAYVNLYLA